MTEQIKGVVTIAADLCKGCGLCTVSCPFGLLRISGSTLNAYGYHPVTVERMEECIGCANCFAMCPDLAITVERGVHAGACYVQNIDERQ